MNIQSKSSQVNRLEQSQILNCKPKLSGISMPGKLRLVMYRANRKTLSQLAKKNKISQVMISYVIHGQRKSKRVEEILSAELKLTLSEIQDIIKEHHSRIAANNPISDQELFDWYQAYRARCGGISVEVMKFREKSKKFTAGYFINKSKREWYYRNSKRSIA